MAKQTINIGSAANDGTGDGLRTSFTKVNANFTELYNFNSSLSIPTDVSDLTDNSNLLGGGGAANTGDVTFTGNIIQGTGYELSLSPGTDFTTGNYTAAPGPELGPQYFRFRGGDNYEHLHFDTSNNSAFDLYLGDDNKYVKLSKDGPVVMGTGGTTLTYKPVGMGWAGLTSNDSSISIFAQGTDQFADNTLGGVTVAGYNGAGLTQIEANDFNTEQFSTWTFRPEGQITFPYLKGNARTGDGENLQFNRSSNQKIISTASGNFDFRTVERLVIAGGDSYYDGTGYPDGEAGDIYLWAGRGFNGGDIKVDAGNSLSAQEGGTVKIRAGSSDVGTGGFVEIRGGYGGDINGEIRLYSGNTQWTYDANGAITLPAGAGTIKNTNGAGNLVTNGYAQLQWTTPTGVGEADPNETSEPKNWVYVESGGVFVETNINTGIGETRTWNFDNSGTLTLPNTAYIDSGIPTVKTTQDFSIGVGDPQKVWNFDQDGNITLPVDGDIVNSDGHSVIKSLPQNQQSSYDNYTLQLSDAGKHILKNDGDGYAVLVPTNADVAFDIGTVITIVSGNSYTYIGASNNGVTEVWGAGFNQTNLPWYIPENSMATLLKIGTDKWMLSGAGLGID